MEQFKANIGPFTVEHAKEIYSIDKWGAPFFNISSNGHVIVHPEGPLSDPKHWIDIKDLVDEISQRGIGLPLLLRFPQILKNRVVCLNEAFLSAIKKHGYQGNYRGVYPIKANQDKYVVECMAKFGSTYHYGLEAGSKPELMAVIAYLDNEESLIICNGYKDEEYIEMALWAQKLNRKIFLVVEKLSELPLIASVAKKMGIRPRIGIRVKLASKGLGHWEASGGDRSKFGLSSSELMEAIAFLQRENLLDCFELVHFHLGSQIASIQAIQKAIAEAGHFYTEIINKGAPLGFVDIGGGLGVDYDGSKTSMNCSIDYTIEEYADVVVSGFRQIFDRSKVAHPTLVSESGRAVVTHHAVLVVDVLGVSECNTLDASQLDTLGAASLKMKYLFEQLQVENIAQSYKLLKQHKEDTLWLFSKGELSLQERVIVENFYWAACKKLLVLAQQGQEKPDFFAEIEKDLADKYFCNFSLFQSLPDSWAVDQLFPVMPLHRLNEEPVRRGVLVDITCDSDGKIDRFIADKHVKNVLELHSYDNKEYYLGMFMVGSYQEILGDLHNLFGNTNIVNVLTDTEGEYLIQQVIPGDTVTDVLAYVGHNRADLLAKIRIYAERALREKRVNFEEAKQMIRNYEQGLSGYTYLEKE